MLLSVVIPTLDSPESLDRLLSSLAMQHLAQEVQVICVNNLSPSYRPKLCHEWSNAFYDFKYIDSGIVGANSARNIGQRFASGDIIYFLDDDCTLPSDPNFLAQIIFEHEKYPHILAIGGPYLKPIYKLSTLAKAYFYIAQCWQEESGQINLLGGNTSYKKVLFENGARFDSHLSYGATEQSLNNHIAQKMFAYHLGIFHHPKLTFLSFLKKAYKQGQGKSYLGLENKPQKDMNYYKYPFYEYLYSLFFSLGFNSKQNLVKQTNILFLRFPLYSKLYTAVIKSYYRGPHRFYYKTIHHFYYHGLLKAFYLLKQGLTKLKCLFVDVFYLLRNNLSKPFIKLYFMTKYHLETYLLPLVKKSRVLIFKLIK